MIIAIDFDDTITEYSPWPIMGRIKPEAVSVIKKIKKAGHTIILWTCRDGKYLDEAVNALKKEGVEFDYINEFPGVPTSRKVYADIYIDDRALGGIVDWNQIENKLLNSQK